MTAILWFKRDLRVADHPAFAVARESGLAILPLYIVEPGLWHQPDASGRQWRFVRGSLVELRDDLRMLGAPLVLRKGDAVSVLEALRQAHDVTHLFSHQETGGVWSFERDLAVGDWARNAGVTWRELRQDGVVRRLSNRDIWQGTRDAFVAQPQIDPAPFNGVEAPSDPLPSSTELGLSPDHCNIQTPGRRAGMATLGSFLIDRGRPYRWAMSTPLEGETACSRMSPHLAWGTFSIREVVQANDARRAEVRGRKDWPQALSSYQSRLAWRDHFNQKLEDEPRLESRSLHPAYDALERDADPVRVLAWARGETGFPFVDACMRFLNARGWLNFRMRSMVVSFASYHLWLDWRITGTVLARQFTDYDPGIHWPQMQMQSGVTGINTIRMYNPVKQGGDQDPEGIFVRRWVPELRAVPVDFIQEPWRWDGARTLAYPAPIVDLKEAGKAARDAVYGIRRRDGFHVQKAAVIAKHASRKRPPARPRKKAPDSRQIGLPFD
ncbi:MAG: deoxyribodipyrimidine photo-lyase [Pseudomonadota bacterium]